MDNLDNFLANLTTHPGIYQMLDEKGGVLYIGKAKNLKKRVSSYFRRQLDVKTLQLTAQIKSIEVTVTRNEREALLLESNLIKAEKPRYNIIEEAKKKAVNFTGLIPVPGKRGML
jgi:excinuclease ABC subunit C